MKVQGGHLDSGEHTSCTKRSDGSQNGGSVCRSARDQTW